MPLPYKPAADSRHRQACFALYRALVRQSLKIPLPNDILENTTNNPIPKQLAPRSSSYLVGSGGGDGRRDGTRRVVNPIPTLIINAFRRNRKLDSPRLICLALKNGYRFLDLLSQAKSQAPPPTQHTGGGVSVGVSLAGAARKLVGRIKTAGREVQSSAPPGAEPKPALLDPSRPVYNQVITFLRENQARVTSYLLNRESTKQPNPFRPHVNHTPLLTLLPPTKNPEHGENDTNPKPVYVSTSRPRPLSELSGGVRKVPTLDACAGYPFLRFSKPQSPVLSVMVWNNARNRQLRVERYMEMKEIDMAMGRQEDEWDHLVERMHRFVGNGGEELDWMEFSAELEEKRQEFLRKTAAQVTKKKTKKKSSDKWRQPEQLDWLASSSSSSSPSTSASPSSTPSTTTTTTTSKQQRDQQQQEEEKIEDSWASRKPVLSYQDSWRISIDETAARLRRQHEHWVSRGRALWGIVQAEKALAEQEAKEHKHAHPKQRRGKQGKGKGNSRYRDKIKDWRAAWERKQMGNMQKRIREAQETGDVQALERLTRQSQNFRVTPPRRVGFSRRQMRNAL